MKKSIKQIIKEIPGDDGWWHSDGEETFHSIFKKLKDLGIEDGCILDILYGAYNAVANEIQSKS